MNSVRAITLDLDDTLWAIGPVIVQAEKRVYERLAANCPAVANTYSMDDLREVRVQVERGFPELKHDLTALRKLTLERVLQECGYDTSHVEPLFEEFMRARNDVALFPDVIPSLQRLSTRFPLVSISNGNADLDRIGLRHFFTASVSAREVGCAKPHPKVFLAACEQAGHPPENVIHIGDHPHQDILGAADVGMKTIWVNREGQTWDHEHQPDAEVRSLSGAMELLLG